MNEVFQRTVVPDSGYVSGFVNLSVLFQDPIGHILRVARLGVDLFTGPDLYGQDMHAFGAFVGFCILVVLVWPLVGRLESSGIAGVLGALLVVAVLVGAVLSPLSSMAACRPSGS